MMQIMIPLKKIQILVSFERILWYITYDILSLRCKIAAQIYENFSIFRSSRITYILF